MDAAREKGDLHLTHLRMHLQNVCSHEPQPIADKCALFVLCVSSRPSQINRKYPTARLLALGTLPGARCSSVVRAFAHGAMGRRIDPSWGGPIELFLVPASAPRLV